MAATRAANGHRQVRLPFLHVQGHHPAEQRVEPLDQGTRDRLAPDVGGDRRVATGLRPQRRHPVRVLEEAHVEHHVGFCRGAVLKPEAQERQHQLRGLLLPRDQFAQLLPQFVHVQL